ncbi:MAG: YigZ family protein [Flavobacteriaceae bacterium]
MSDTYTTLAKPSPQILFKEKKSKFYGHAYPIDSEDRTKVIIESLRGNYPNANHVCWAWKLGLDDNARYRTNDDGEPNNTAGMPIYGQIQSFGITNVLVAVARIFGGTKLGVGGLISAYRESAKITLDASEFITKFLEEQMELHFQYPHMDKVMRILRKHQAHVVSKELHLDCSMVVRVRKNTARQFLSEIQSIFGVSIIHKPTY